MPTQRLSIADAAAHFDVHPTTIRRRIARGELQAERENDEPNGKVFVLVDVPEGDDGVGASAEAAPAYAQADGEAPLTQRLSAEVTWLREELTHRDHEISHLLTLLDQQQRLMLTQGPGRSPEVPATLKTGEPARGNSRWQTVHLYLSALLPAIFVALGGVTLIVSFFTVESATVQWIVIGLCSLAIVALLVMSNLRKRWDSKLAQGQPNRRAAVAAIGLYVTSVLIFIACTVLLVLY